MAGRHKSDALLRLTLLLVLFISFANLPVTVHAGSPDLTIDSIWLEDASQIGQPLSQLSAGQSFNIIATIKNIGQDAASGYYLDVYYDSDYGRGGPDNIAPGEVQTWYVGPLTAQAGTHTTTWVADPDTQIPELVETNNQKQLVFTVGSTTVTTTVTSNSTFSTAESTSTTTTTMTSSSTSSTTQLTSTSTSSLLVTHALGWLPEDIPEDARVTPIVSAALPTHFDWTQKDSQNWITSVKNQGGCGSCVAFSAVGALEGQLKIQANNPSWNIDLSEQHLFSCGGGTCSGGWYISAALNYLQQYGTPDEACSPYQGGSGSCSNSCPNWQTRAYKISSWNWVLNDPSAIEAAVMNGPVVAGFTVYTDFFSYNGGVYHYDGHSPLAGGHAIVIVGYDSNERYWIVKNSWGTNWGEHGYFKIGFGEAGIEQWVATVKAVVNPPSPPAVPTLVSPNDGATLTTTTTTLQWSGVSGATFYMPEVWQGSTLVWRDWPGGTSFTVPSGKLSPGVTYQWRVYAANSQGYGPPSPYWSFTVAGGGSLPSAPVLSSPSDGASVSTATPRLQWSAVPGASFYMPEVWQGSTLVWRDWPGGTSLTVPSGKLSPGVTYQWRVYAANSQGYGPPSASWSYTVAGGGLSAPTLMSPSDGVIISTTTPGLCWAPVSGATFYMPEVWQGSTLVWRDWPGATCVAVPSGKVSPSVTYQWRVYAANAQGYGPPSASWSFSAGGTGPPSIAPVLVSPNDGAALSSATPTLRWNAVAGASFYMVEVWQGDTLVWRDWPGATSMAVPSGRLQPGQSYQWRIYAANAQGYGPPSAFRSFTVA